MSETRGSTIFWTVTFYNKNGDPVDPSGATLKIAYKVAGVLTTIAVDMVDGGSHTWTYEWDSSLADVGYVEWWAQSTDAPKSALQGSFELDANRANPQG